MPRADRQAAADRPGRQRSAREEGRSRPDHRGHAGKGLPVTYVLYPEEGHGFAVPENRISFNAIAEAFLAAHLGGRAEPIGEDFAGAKLEVGEGASHVPGLEAALAGRACRTARVVASRIGVHPSSATAPPSGCGDMIGDSLLFPSDCGTGPARPGSRGRRHGPVCRQGERGDGACRRPRDRRPRGSPQLAAARLRGQDRHRRGQLPVFRARHQVQGGAAQYGVQVEVRRTTRSRKEGRSTLRPLEGPPRCGRWPTTIPASRRASSKAAWSAACKAAWPARGRRAGTRTTRKLRSVGRLFHEPVWVFTRGDLPITTLRDLKGKRILIGTRDSGSRGIATLLLLANDVIEENATFIDEDLEADAGPSSNGRPTPPSSSSRRTPTRSRNSCACRTSA